MKIYFHNVLSDAYIDIYGDPFRRPGSGAENLKTPPLAKRVVPLRKTLMKHNPDILLLNESCRELHHALLPRYVEVAFLEDEISQEIPGQQKPGMAVLVNVSSGLSCEKWSCLSGSHSIHLKINGLNFIVHHNDPEAYGGDEQLDSLMTSMSKMFDDEEPIILAGDFNNCPYPRSTFVKRLSNYFEDPWDWDVNRFTYSPCYPKCPGKRYDYILVRNVRYEKVVDEPIFPKNVNGWRGMADILRECGSDHVPVILQCNT